MRKIAIVAKGATSSSAPWYDREWEVWGMPWISYPRVDVYFDMHEQGFYEGDFEGDSFWYEEKWLDRLDGKPIYCFPSRMHLSGAVEYPLKEITEGLPSPYLENTIAYMMALAIHQGADQIGLWGVHMRGIREYEIERSSVAYMVGLAQGKGIDVHIPPGNPLLASAWEQGRYGVNRRKRSFHPSFTPRQEKN